MLQALLFVNTVAFADAALNLDETVAECLAATLIMHYSCSQRVIHEALSVKSIGEAELLAWSATVRSTFTPPIPKPTMAAVNPRQYFQLLRNSPSRSSFSYYRTKGSKNGS
ncbi:hypothetical protein PHMEG_00026057 [Phytophthora megakarya]|uniref:Uncharacterized protein n=1 Tax=Phytophthora megakarya TaxID=4795 RepID=A0A225VAM9_9STRA|nr:hypothetical protein PHMEG_00026057 [Phytophthora megakarya]